MAFFVCFNHMLKYFGHGQKHFYESNKAGYFCSKIFY